MQGLVKVLPEESLNKLDYQSNTYEHENLKAKQLDETMLDNQDIPNPFNYLQPDHFNKRSSKPSSDNPFKPSNSPSFDHIENFKDLRKAKPLLIQPKYSAQSLEEQLQSIMEVKNTPMEFYEIQLYNLCKKFSQLLSGKDFDFTCVDDIHHIFQLKSRLSYLSDSEVTRLDLNLEYVLNYSPTAWIQYNIFTEALAILSALLVKWKMVSKYNYSYRTSGRAINARILDIKEMNKNILTMETLWMSEVVKSSPWKEILDESVRQYAIILQNQTLKTMRMLLRMNQSCDFDTCPSIDGIVAAQRVKMVDRYGLWPDFEAKPVHYQRLRQPTGLIARCFKDPTQYRAQMLKESLAELELVYRTFEQNLIGNFLYVYGMNGNRKRIPKIPSIYYDS